MFPGPGGLDGGIQGQQVGLLRDRLDGVEEARHLAGVGLELVDELGALVDLFRQVLDGLNVAGNVALALVGVFRRALGLFRGVTGERGHLFHALDQFIDGVARRGDGRGLIVDALQVGAAGFRQLLGDLLKAFHVIADGAEGGMQLLDEGIEVGHQFPQFILAVVVDAGGEVSLPGGHVAQGFDHAVEAAGDGAGNEQAQYNQCRNGDGRNGQPQGGAALGARDGAVDGAVEGGTGLVTQLRHVVLELLQALRVGRGILAQGPEVGVALNKGRGNAGGLAVIALEFAGQLIEAVLHLRGGCFQLIKIVLNALVIGPGLFQLVLVARGDRGIDLGFHELKLAKVHRGAFHGGVEFVIDLVQALGVLTLGVEVEPLGCHQGDDGDPDQKSQFQRN